MAATPAQCGPDPLQCTEAEDSLEAAFGLEAKYARAAGSPAAWPCDDSDDSDADGCDLPDVQLPACDQAACLEAALRSEGEVLVDCAYLQRQPAVDASVRTRLVEWVLLASRRHRFSLRTSSLAVHLLDRFLSAYKVQPSLSWLLQLSVTACLSVAAKMEESTVPLLADLQVGATTRFETKFVQKMELLVLSTLSWRVATPTPVTFTEHFLRSLGAATQLRPRQLTQLRCHARAVLRACLPVAGLVGTKPSTLALAALHHALRCCAPNSAVLRVAADVVPLTADATACMASLGTVLGPQWSTPGMAAPTCGATATIKAVATKPAVPVAYHHYVHAPLRAKPGAGADRDSPTSTLAGDLFTDLSLHSPGPGSSDDEQGLLVGDVSPGASSLGLHLTHDSSVAVRLHKGAAAAAAAADSRKRRSVSVEFTRRVMTRSAMAPPPQQQPSAAAAAAPSGC